MNRQSLKLPLSAILVWLDKFQHAICLHSHQYSLNDPYAKFDILIGADAEDSLNVSNHALDALKAFHEKHQDWMFGLLTYDLKNEIENLNSSKADPLAFPPLFFFVPRYVLGIKNNEVTILKGSPDLIQEILACERDPFSTNGKEQNLKPNADLHLKPKMDKSVYLQQVQHLKNHISRGDIYEVTFCQEFYADQAKIDPIKTFYLLSENSPTPFSSFFKIADKFILSASPERYLAKRGQQIFSQPIKGTARRGKDSMEDEQIKITLRNNPKELAENVMIVDLVRNDLTRCAKPGTVKVEELFGLYTFPQVHQLISTISCELQADLHFTEAIRSSFPMGSMTGAPKIRAMELIEDYEKSKRGAFSGSIGWISPDGDFDFNVLIRTLFYNESAAYLSFQVGGAITDLSDIEEEYKETLLKARALFQTLKASL